MNWSIRVLGWSCGLLWILLILGPLLLLGESLSWSDLQRGLSEPAFASALGLSLQTSAISLSLTLILGTPVAWHLARSPNSWTRGLDSLFELPIVIPPAVVGVALLSAFGRQGELGQLLASIGLQMPFSTKAVVLAQLVVASPFYVQGAKSAFTEIDEQYLEVAQTLGASWWQRFTRVALPLAWPGLMTAASLAWARALGEFGATLIFAGNRVGSTQTMPLAIFSALESDVTLAVVFSLALAATGILLLCALRWMGAAKRRRA